MGHEKIVDIGILLPENFDLYSRDLRSLIRFGVLNFDIDFY